MSPRGTEARASSSGTGFPATGPGTTGLGKPLKSILHGRKGMPIFTASIGPAGIECSAEVADGLIPVWMSPERMDLLTPSLAKGFARSNVNNYHIWS